MIDHLHAALAGRYRSERELGQGGMATVYLAHDEKKVTRAALIVVRHCDVRQANERHFDVSRNGKHCISVKRPVGSRSVTPVVVLHWGEAVKRLLAAVGIK